MAKFVCPVCGADKPVPNCCGNEEMKSNGSYLVCTFCGAIQYFPMHCSKLMKVKE
ncbi:MAG: hypothetical protein V1835_03360 [Candidatus Micrarchaeota archaeon]